jgi:metal-responsive CopG/Arc/MetJ family transcriptional regulator
MEVTALKGSSGDVKHLADHVIAERGVRYGRLKIFERVVPAPQRRSNE